jgi:sensor histidine kinase YesM
LLDLSNWLQELKADLDTSLALYSTAIIVLYLVIFKPVARKLRATLLFESRSGWHIRLACSLLCTYTQYSYLPLICVILSNFDFLLRLPIHFVRSIHAQHSIRPVVFSAHTSSNYFSAATTNTVQVIDGSALFRVTTSTLVRILLGISGVRP